MRPSRSVPTILTALYLLVTTVVSPRAQQAPVPLNFAGVEAAVRAELKQTQAPGAAIAVVSGDRVVYMRAFGVANVETGDEMRPEMLFRLGSTTKMFTAAAVVLLAEQGTLSLTDPIGKHVTGLTPKLAALTAHQLLSHTSGILDEAPMFGSHDDEAMKKEVSGWTDTRFFAEPEQVYSYSNPGYWLAGLLAETVGGKPFADQVASTIFVPLGMTRSTFRPTIAMTYPLAQGHDVVDGRPRIIRPAADNSASWPAGSIFSNVQELSRWMTAFVNGGRIGGEQALPASVFATMATPRTSIPGTTHRYGYGVRVGEWRGLQMVEHSGSRAGYGSIIRMVPAHHLGVVVLANRTGVSLTRTANAAIEAVIGSHLGRDAVTVVHHPARASAAEIVGTYSQGGSRRLVVEQRDGQLVLVQGTRVTPLEDGGSLPLLPANERILWAGTASYVFVLDETGRAGFLHTGGRSWRRVQ